MQALRRQNIIISGTSSVIGAVVHISTSGVLAGILIESGAAEKISENVVEKNWRKKSVVINSSSYHDYNFSRRVYNSGNLMVTSFMLQENQLKWTLRKE